MKKLLIFLLVPLTVLAEPAPGLRADHQGFSPAEALEQFTVADGFSVDLIAAEPDIAQPIAFTFDEKGRIWLAEGYSYPQRRKDGEGHDRILILEDTDGDGSFDSKKVFIDNLNLVSGIEVGFGGVYVGAAPYLMHIPILDGDKAGEPEILLDGWGYQDTHETLNSFTWGPDGWLYGCHGVFTYSSVGKPGTPKRERENFNAAIWRFHPVTKKFEVFARGTSNPWGLDYNERGDFFVEACVIPHFWNITQGGYYQRQAGNHANPYVFDDIKTIADHLHYPGGNQWETARNGTADAFGGGHAHSGLAIYLSENFPEDFQGDALFFNLHGHRLNRDKLEMNGSGWVAKHGTDPMLSNDRAFIGVSAKVGPDGAVYFIDWQDIQTCHHKDPVVWDRSNGRMYRLKYKGWRPAQPGLAWQDTDAFRERLVSLTESKNEWEARAARRVVQENANGLGEGMRKLLLAKLSTGEPRFRLRALWTLKASAQLQRSDLVALLSDKSPELRMWAVRLLCEDKLAVSELDAFAKKENSPEVLLALASALQRIPAEARWNLAESLASAEVPEDDPNLQRMIWFGIEALAENHPARFAKITVTSTQATLVRNAARKLSDKSEWAPALTTSLANAEGSNLAWTVEGILRHVQAKHGQKLDPTVEKALAAFPAGSDVSPMIIETLALAGSDTTLDLLSESYAKDPSSERGIEAFKILSSAHREKDSGIFIAGLADAKTRLMALHALQHHPSQELAARIFEFYPSFGTEERLSANALLSSFPETAARLLGEIKAAKIPARHLSAQHARQIRAMGDAELTGLLEKFWGKLPDATAEFARLMETISPESIAGSDLEKGVELFANSCGACHTLKGKGGRLGPDLTGSNRANLEYLLINILMPDAAVGDEYVNHELRLKNGQTLLGLVSGKPEQDLSVRYPGGERLVPRSGLLGDKTTEKSLMPEGSLAPLSDEEIRDLLGYLMR